MSAGRFHHIRAFRAIFRAFHSFCPNRIFCAFIFPVFFCRFSLFMSRSSSILYNYVFDFGNFRYGTCDYMRRIGQKILINKGHKKIQRKKSVSFMWLLMRCVVGLCGMDFIRYFIQISVWATFSPCAQGGIRPHRDSNRASILCLWCFLFRLHL